jgi:hypothetical protein
LNSLSPDRKRQLLALLVTASCLTGCREAPEEPQVALRLRYQVGDTLYYEYTANGTATYPDTVTAEKTTKTYERHLRVDEVATDVTPGGNYLLAWTYHLPAKVEDGVEREPSDITIYLEISPQGRIIDVTNLETAKTVFHDMDFRTYLEQTQPVFPERALKIGDSWTQQVKVLSPEAEPVVTTSNYVLEDLTEEDSEPIAIIAFDGDVYLPNAPEKGDDPSTVSAEERIRVRGRMYFAHERGQTVRVETKAEAEIMRLTVEDGSVARRSIEIKQQSHLRLVDP